MNEQIPIENKLDQSEALDWPPGLVNSAGFLLNRVGKKLREQLNAALLPLHLTTQELGVLRIISDQGPLSQQALGRKNFTDRTTIVHLLDDLEERKLVIRIRNQTDRRSHLLFLTPRGKKTLARAIKVIEREQAVFLNPLTIQEWQSMQSNLIKLLVHHEKG